MNCQDIARILDSRDVNGLSAAERRTCEEHALSCHECGAEWVVYTRLAATPVPSLPPGFALRCEAVAAARNMESKRRHVGRMVLLGTVLVVAAAAAMLSGQLMNPPPIAGAKLAPTPEPESAGAAVAAESPVADNAEPKAHDEKIEPTEGAVMPFTVRVMPLQNEVTDPAEKRSVASMYAAFVSLLRETPGATLLESNPAENGPEAQPDYRIAITGKSGPGNWFGADLRADALKTLRSFYTSSMIDVAPKCISAPLTNGVGAARNSCADPEGVAAGLVQVLRKMVFPPDPSLGRQLQARLLDKSLDAQQRGQALWDLAQVGWMYYGRAGKASTGALLRDPAVIRGAIDLATSATDPKVRAITWNTLRGIGNAELVLPLLVALGQDPDSEVRLAALGTLAADFGEDPRVHPALKAVAERDTRSLVRALAQSAASGSTGDAAWNEYIIASLKDSTRSAVERIEALLYQMDLPATSTYMTSATHTTPQHALNLLDKDAIKALTEALPKAAADSSIVMGSANSLMSALGNIDHPAITDMLLASLYADSQWLSRGTATEALGALASRRSDPRVHAVLEKISASDPDPEVRQIAAEALQKDFAFSADGTLKPPRLGVSYSDLTLKPDTPKELIGKPVVMAVGPESVAQRAGVQEGDVLLEINGTNIPSGLDVSKIVDTVPRGVDVDVLVYRSGATVNLKARF